jgi:hypothetical protein
MKIGVFCTGMVGQAIGAIRLWAALGTRTFNLKLVR